MLEHKHIIIRATVNKPPKDVNLIKTWVRNLVEKLNVAILSNLRGILCFIDWTKRGLAY